MDGLESFFRGVEALAALILACAAIYTAWWTRKTFGHDRKILLGEDLISLVINAKAAAEAYIMARFVCEDERGNFLSKPSKEEITSMNAHLSNTLDKIRSQLANKIYDEEIESNVRDLVHDYQYQIELKYKEHSSFMNPDNVPHSVSKDFEGVILKIKSESRL